MPEQTYTVDPNATEATTTHLLYDGEGGWIEAKRVWIEMPHPELDGAESGPGWQFKTVHDGVRWLRAPDEDDRASQREGGE